MKNLLSLYMVFILAGCVNNSEIDSINIISVDIVENKSVIIELNSTKNYFNKKINQVGSYIYCESSKINKLSTQDLTPDNSKKALSGVIYEMQGEKNGIYTYKVILEKVSNFELRELGDDVICQRFTGSMISSLKKSEKFNLKLKN